MEAIPVAFGGENTSTELVALKDEWVHALFTLHYPGPFSPDNPFDEFVRAWTTLIGRVGPLLAVQAAKALFKDQELPPPRGRPKRVDVPELMAAYEKAPRPMKQTVADRTTQKAIQRERRRQRERRAEYRRGIIVQLHPALGDVYLPPYECWVLGLLAESDKKKSD